MIKVAVTMPATIADAGEYLADVRALEAAGADMIAVEGDSDESRVVLAAVAAVTERIRLRATGSPPESLRRLMRGRAVAETPAGETWVELPMPSDRAGWMSAIRDLETSGVTGVLVRWDPRLIDLLRNPEADDRSDLLMSTG